MAQLHINEQITYIKERAKIWACAFTIGFLMAGFYTVILRAN